MSAQPDRWSLEDEPDQEFWDGFRAWRVDMDEKFWEQGGPTAEQAARMEAETTRAIGRRETDQVEISLTAWLDGRVALIQADYDRNGELSQIGIDQADELKRSRFTLGLTADGVWFATPAEE